eukprot:scaffold173737_cov15-Prasinocladus_malaysianus.AAC.1
MAKDKSIIGRMAIKISEWPSKAIARLGVGAKMTRTYELVICDASGRLRLGLRLRPIVVATT